MTRGVLMYAHNNRDVDYARIAIVSASLAKKNLGLPVSLVTDDSTTEWMQSSNIYPTAQSVFDQIIVDERPEPNNTRKLQDMQACHNVLFTNQNRSSAWYLTPYQETLLIDCDFIVQSNRLNSYWDIDQSFLISSAALDINTEDRLKYMDRYVSSTGPKMLWATTVMFKKDLESKLIFDLVETIRENYTTFASLYRFDSLQYRNDIAFSVAKHIADGFEESTDYFLPDVLTTLDKDCLSHVNNDRLCFLIDKDLTGKYYVTSLAERDVHVMNKKSITRNYEALLDSI